MAHKPGTITAVQVLLGLAAAANAVSVLLGIASASLAAAMTSGLPDIDAESAAMLAGARTALVMLSIYSVAAAAFDIWALVAVGKRRTIARLLITLTPVLAVSFNIAATMVAGGGAAEGGVSIAFVIPLSATLIILLWLPRSSRAWFGDVAPAAPPAPAFVPAFVPAFAHDPVTVPIPVPRRMAPPALGPRPPFAPVGQAGPAAGRRP
ncbi:hypothetical protein ACQPX6_25185 [Actinomycetospora sp. CA-101289]|uniref:hypothetical protein n=1 Tax=Actinomycetospora sp. CA-101289 TaxID=3239893 RepID=UPI003D97DD8B